MSFNWGSSISYLSSFLKAKTVKLANMKVKFIWVIKFRTVNDVKLLFSAKKTLYLQVQSMVRIKKEVDTKLAYR